MDNPTLVRTRIAPSPTGELHIGGLRTLLYDYALAKKHNGQFILRIEDTDQKRFVPGSQERIMQVIKDYHLSWDEGPDVGGPYGPYIQTERLDIYKKYIQILLDKGLAYYCFCTQERLDNLREQQKDQKKLPKYDQHCLYLSKEEIQKNLDSNVPYTIRMAIPKNETVVFEDLIRGKIKFNTNDIDDQVLIKSNGVPTYHFAVVVDDHLMNITHVLRAEEWLSSSPKHVLLYKYFAWDMPKTAHLTVLLDPDHKGKMSKRHGSVHARVFLENGYLPEAVLNFLMLLGWNPGTEQEIFTLSDFIEQFSLEKLNKKAPAFDRKKLDYLNGLYIRQKNDSELVELLRPFIPQASFEILMQIIPLIKERITTLKDAANLTKFLFEDVSCDKNLLLQKNITPELAHDMLSQSLQLIESIENWQVTNIQPALLDLIKSNSWNTGQFFMVFRVAICGSVSTPPVVDCLPIIGKEATLRKINLAIDLLN